jgi:CheY-like chemotaxis protein
MSREKSEKNYLTPNEVAELLMVSTESVRLWSQKGWLKAETTPGGHRRYLRHSVERFAQERGLNSVSQNSGELRILVVDDDRQFSSYLIELLTGKGDFISVSAVYDGFSAGAQVHSFRPDIVLLDLMMPNVDGFEVCKMLKERAETSSIRIFAMTGYPSDENVARILLAGAEACLAKPIDSQALLQAIGLSQNNAAAQ